MLYSELSVISLPFAKSHACGCNYWDWSLPYCDLPGCHWIISFKHTHTQDAETFSQEGNLTWSPVWRIDKKKIGSYWLSIWVAAFQFHLTFSRKGVPAIIILLNFRNTHNSLKILNWVQALLFCTSTERKSNRAAKEGRGVAQWLPDDPVQRTSNPLALTLSLDLPSFVLYTLISREP